MATEETNGLNPPDLLIFSGEGEKWKKYEDDLFAIFKSTIADGELKFQGLPVNPRRFPEEKGKHFTFWHLITEGDTESERTPDLRRCERIGWVAWIIRNCGTSPDITFWESKRGTARNFVLWYEKGQFAVILSKRSRYFILLSAYFVDEDHRIEAFKRDRDEYQKSAPKN